MGPRGRRRFGGVIVEIGDVVEIEVVVVEVVVRVLGVEIVGVVVVEVVVIGVVVAVAPVLRRAAGERLGRRVGPDAGGVEQGA